MFDFHEGNLSAVEKSELLNFIHLYPEYEKDFALWAQSYIPVENSVPEFNLTTSLLQKPVDARSNYHTMSIITSALIIGIAILYFMRSDSSKPTTDNFPLQIDKLTSSNSVIQSKKIQISTKNNVHKKTQEKFETSEQLHILDTVVIIHKTDSLVREKNILTINLNDTIQQTISITDSVGKSVPVDSEEHKVRKRKSKFSIKPSDSFIPTNPDF